MVGRVVSAQPPWSTATSTSTEPSRIAPIISRVMTFGAAEPGTSTAPMTRSDSASVSASVTALDFRVAARFPKMSSSARIRAALFSRIVTSEPSPTAILAAFSPTTPPPTTAVRPRGTPGTPPSRIPEPPQVRCRWWAPSWMAIRPATSLIGVSSGRLPSSEVIVS